MTDYQDHARAKNGAEQPHGRRRAAGPPATGSNRTVRTRVIDTAVIGTAQPAPSRRPAVFRVARRAAVVTVSCAVLIGAAAAGHVGSSPATPASTVQALLPEASATSTPAEALATVAAERSAITADPAPEPTPDMPAEPAPAPASAEPEPAPGSTDSAPAPASAEPAPATPASATPEPAGPASATLVPTAPASTATPEPVAAAVAVDDPAGAQAYALSQLGSYGWGAGQMPCLTTLWTKESDWRTTATNPTSGAYGIVQSLPAEKMASAGADYRTNYRTQITWGLNYIKDRYQSPCGALNFHLANNWY